MALLLSSFLSITLVLKIAQVSHYREPYSLTYSYAALAGFGLPT